MSARWLLRWFGLTLLACGGVLLAILQYERQVVVRGDPVPRPAVRAEVLAASRLCPNVEQIARSWTPRQRAAQQILAYLPPDARLDLGGAVPGGVLLHRDHGPEIGAIRAYAERLRGVRGTAALVGGATAPPLLAIDQEGGRVTRIDDPALERYPPNGEIGALARGDALASVRRQGADFAAALRDSGVHVNFAPVVDVATAENDVISAVGRAYSDDPAVVAELSRTFVQALQAGGVAATLKHFPGHGMVTEDSHVALPRSDIDPGTLEAVHLRPYRDLLTHPSTDEDRLLVMTAHVLFEALDPVAPASLSRAVTTGLLRDDLGFDGVIVTDALGMGALDGTVAERAVRALSAGADMVLLEPGLETHLPDVLDALVTAYERGAPTWRDNRASLERILRLKRALGLVVEPEGCLRTW